MRLKFVLFLLLNVRVLLVCSQDSLTVKRYFELEVGFTETIPDIKSEKSTSGPGTGVSNYDFQVKNFTTSGFNIGLEGLVSKRRNLDLLVKMHYDHFSYYEEKVGREECYTCYFQVNFNGKMTERTSFNILGISPTIRYNVGKTIFENSLGVSNVLTQHTENFQHDVISNSESTVKSDTKHVFFFLRSSHRIGYELIRNRMFLLTGLNLFYDLKELKNFKRITNYNPEMSIKFKI